MPELALTSLRFERIICCSQLHVCCLEASGIAPVCAPWQPVTEASLEQIDNKKVVRRFVEELLGGQDLNSASSIIAENFVAHHPQFPGDIRGPGGLLQAVAMFRVAFPDLRYRVEELVAEGNMVAVRWSASGTHRGQFLHLPPSGAAFSISGMDLFRVEGGKCVEGWVNSDMLGLFQQLGAIPTPQGPA